MALRFLRPRGGRAKRLGQPTRAAQQPLGLLGHYIALYSVNGPEALRSVEFSERCGWREFADRVRWTSRLSRRITAAPPAISRPATGVGTYLLRPTIDASRQSLARSPAAPHLFDHLAVFRHGVVAVVLSSR
jgi:hypothetical protein